MRRWRPSVSVLLLVIVSVLRSSADAAEGPRPGMYVIFDASGSMSAKLADKTTRIDTAKRVLAGLREQDFTGYDVALRVYGSRRKEDCSDSELLVPFGAVEATLPRIKAAAAKLTALGRTPITFSLQEALKDFGERRGEIILITDGIESCGADPCALMREWRGKNVDIRVHVVGFGVSGKEREALKCIADESGAEYRDAQSGAELKGGLEVIRKQAAKPVLWLRGVDRAGNRVAVAGTLASADGKSEPIEVSSASAVYVAPGRYTLRAAVRTANGNLYRPVDRAVDVKEHGATVVQVEVELPPRVKVRFDHPDDRRVTASVHAFQQGREVFKFRSIDEVFVDEGKYEFRSRPEADNDLSVGESFATGDRKEVVFAMQRTVLVTIKMIASGSGTHLRDNVELWQDGKKRYMVHMINGAWVVPGIYTLRFAAPLTEYEQPGLVITEKPQQDIAIEVPVGFVTVVYQRADGSRDGNKRSFIGRTGTNERHYRQSGDKHPVRPGSYRAVGWGGTYDEVTFEIAAGEEKEIVLRARP